MLEYLGPEPNGDQLMMNVSPEVRSSSDIHALIKELGHAPALSVLKRLAEDGNSTCQVFISGALLNMPKERRTREITENIEKFTKMAAESGHAGSQFNLALFYSQSVNLSEDTFSEQDVSFLAKAKYWHGRAAAQGFLEAKRCLDALNSGPSIRAIEPKA